VRERPKRKLHELNAPRRTEKRKAGNFYVSLRRLEKRQRKNLSVREGEKVPRSKPVGICLRKGRSQNATDQLSNRRGMEMGKPAAANKAGGQRPGSQLQA